MAHGITGDVSCAIVTFGTLVMYSPLQSTGLGLSDGEVMERMWSYLRRFSRMTKEIRPAHRVNVLAHALLYYGLGIKNKLRKKLLVC